ncbi:UDP-Gal betaGal beta 1,3-galactosyltransferase, polypeptide 6 [Trebouxia sp. C0010 RCD-2024]
MNILDPEAAEVTPLQFQPRQPKRQGRRDTFQLPYITVVVVVTSVAGWSDRRERIRAQFPRNVRLIPDNGEQSVLLKFAVGRHGPSQEVISNVTLEAAKFADILMLDCLDEDDSLNTQANWALTAGVSATTSKVMLSVKWAVRHFDFDYFFRLGDDSYFRIDKFMSMISDQQIPARSAVVGHILHDHVFGELQPYPQGMGYGLTYDVCIFIAGNEGHLLNTAPEDCVVARWLMAVGAKFIDSPHWRDIALGEGCEPDMVLAHKLPADLWSNITDSGTIEC